MLVRGTASDGEGLDPFWAHVHDWAPLKALFLCNSNLHELQAPWLVFCRVKQLLLAALSAYTE